MGQRVITLENCRKELEKGGVIQRERLYWSYDRWKQYKLLKSIHVELSDGTRLIIPKGFEWDLSSSPRLLWAIIPPDGDFEIASLIHDFLYQNKIGSRKFADVEMYRWSVASNGTIKISIKNWDNRVRYLAVRAFGWYVWNKR